MNCPQCHAPLEATTLAEGMEFRRCPRCGWSDAGSAQPAASPPSAAPVGETRAGWSPRTTRIFILIIAVDMVITLAVVALLLVFKKS